MQKEMKIGSDAYSNDSLSLRTVYSFGGGIEALSHLDVLEWPWFLAAVLQFPGLLLLSESLPLFVLLGGLPQSCSKTGQANRHYQTIDKTC